jgi:phosphoserine phosphatase RsbU/P
VGLVLADVSGKGISGAMMMANLQANLRSQYALALEDLPGLLSSVNRLFYENTPDSCYATLFFGDYNDADRRLRYANCGHNAPLLLRVSGKLERLAATATVLGLFDEWTCSVEEVLLQPGDLLVMYTDGISEAPDDSGAEFGEVRLVETMRANCQLSPTALIEKIQATVQQFSRYGQADDLTMVIGRSVGFTPLCSEQLVNAAFDNHAPRIPFACRNHGWPVEAEGFPRSLFREQLSVSCWGAPLK